MDRKLLLLIGVWLSGFVSGLLASSAFAQTRPVSSHVFVGYGNPAFGGAYVATIPAIPYSIPWQNDTGGPIYLLGVKVWVGWARGVIADTSYSLVSSDGQTLDWNGWDHYADGDGNIMHEQVWMPPYLPVVAPGATITMIFSATGSNPLDPRYPTFNVKAELQYSTIAP